MVPEGAHQAGHHPGGEVLEGGGRPLIEAHDVFAGEDVLQRHRVVVGVGDDPLERPGPDLLREKGLCDKHRGFSVRRSLQGLECPDGEGGNRFGHEKPFVWGLPHQEGLPEGDGLSEGGDAPNLVQVAVGAVVSYPFRHAENLRSENILWRVIIIFGRRTQRRIKLLAISGHI